MTTITQPRIAKLPRKGSRPSVLLETLLVGPGTFYQICERAKFDIDARGGEGHLRAMFADMVGTGLVNLAGITYSISARARVTFELLRGEKYVGLVAAPHFRGVVVQPAVRIVSRPARAARHAVASA